MVDVDTSFAMRIERSMAGLAQLGVWVDAVAANLSLPAAVEYALRLCVEEAVANVVMHGVPDSGADASAVALRLDPGSETMRLTIEDGCAAFDPLQVVPPERPTTPAEVRVGGLGVHLMRQFAREIDYARVSGRNRLTLTIGRTG